MTDKVGADDAIAAAAAAPAAPLAEPEPPAPAVEKVEAGTAPVLAVGAKRARSALSLHEKAVVKSFCEQKVGESKARGEMVPSQDKLRREIASKFGWSCGRSTLSKIVAMDWKQLQQGTLQNPNMKRQRRPLFPALEADLVAFIAAFIGSASERAAGPDVVGMLPGQANELSEAGAVDGAKPPADRGRGGKPVLTEALILEEAQRLKQVHGIRDEQLVLSVGWLARFKHRHGIRLRKTSAGARAGGDARTREGGEMRAMATPGGASTALPTGVDAVNWSAVDPLLLASTGNVLDALHMTDSDAMAVGNTARSTPLAAISTPGLHDRQAVDTNKARHILGETQVGAVEVMASISTPSTLCGTFAPPTALNKDDSAWQAIMDKVPTEIRSLACCCGCSELRSLSREGVSGLCVVVVGANSTLAAFIAAALVGERGSVACIDPVKASTKLGAKHADKYVREVLRYPTTAEPAIQFIATDSFPPDLGGLRATADIVVVNCSLQTGATRRAQRTLTVMSALLKPGGELRFTTVCSSRRLWPEESAEISPSLETAKKQLLRPPYYVDMCLLCEKLGRKTDLRTLVRPLDQTSAGPFIGDANTKFYRCTFRIFAIEDTEPTAEDYGQVATFTGCTSDASDVLQLSESTYRLDDELCFARGDRVAVDGNTALVLQTSWMRGRFTVEGGARRHRGGFQRAGWRAALKTCRDDCAETQAV